MSKRLAVTLLGKAASTALVVYAIWSASHYPESATQIAAICSTCVTVIVAGAHGYTLQRSPATRAGRREERLATPCTG